MGVSSRKSMQVHVSEEINAKMQAMSQSSNSPRVSPARPRRAPDMSFARTSKHSVYAFHEFEPLPCGIMHPPFFGNISNCHAYATNCDQIETPSCKTIKCSTMQKIGVEPHPGVIRCKIRSRAHRFDRCFKKQPAGARQINSAARC